MEEFHCQLGDKCYKSIEKCKIRFKTLCVNVIITVDQLELDNAYFSTEIVQEQKDKA